MLIRSVSLVDRWCKDPDATASKRGFRQWEVDFHGRAKRSGYLLDSITERQAKNMSPLFNLLGYWSMIGAFDEHLTEKRTNPGTDASLNKSQAQQALYMLQIAVAYQNLESATWLLKLRQAPQLANLGLTVTTSEAKNLVDKWVSETPQDCPWQTVSVYMEDATSLAELRKQTPSQREWHAQCLQHAAGKILPGAVLGTTHAWQVFANPWTLLQRMLDNCLDYRLSVDGYTEAGLKELRLTCLRNLTEYNDPAACFEIATSEKEFGSKDWVKLMVSAARNEKVDACWLLSIHYWREWGLLDLHSHISDGKLVDERALNGKVRARKKQLSKSPVVADDWLWALYGILGAKDRTNVLLNRAYAFIALLRTFVAIEEGRGMLEALVESTDTLPLKHHQRDKLEEVLEDYNEAGEQDPDDTWGLKYCLESIEKITSPSAAKALGIHPDWLPKSPQLSSV